MISDGRITGTRITVLDVLHHLENGCSSGEIAEVLRISIDQVGAAEQYIQVHCDEVRRIHRQIEQRNAVGNPPEVTQKADASRARRDQWLINRHKTVSS